MCLDDNNSNNDNNSISQSFLIAHNISLMTRARVTLLPLRYRMKWGHHSAGSHKVYPMLIAMYFSRGKSLKSCSSFAGVSTLSATHNDCSSPSLDVYLLSCCRFPQPDSLSSFLCAGGGGGARLMSPRCASRDLDCLFGSIAQMFCTVPRVLVSYFERALMPEKRTSVLVFISLVPPIICNCHPNSHQHLYRHVGILQIFLIFFLLRFPLDPL